MTPITRIGGAILVVLYANTPFPWLQPRTGLNTKQLIIFQLLKVKFTQLTFLRIIAMSYHRFLSIATPRSLCDASSVFQGQVYQLSTASHAPLVVVLMPASPVSATHPLLPWRYTTTPCIHMFHHYRGFVTRQKAVTDDLLKGWVACIAHLVAILMYVRPATTNSKQLLAFKLLLV